MNALLLTSIIMTMTTMMMRARAMIIRSKILYCSVITMIYHYVTGLVKYIQNADKCIVPRFLGKHFIQ